MLHKSIHRIRYDEIVSRTVWFCSSLFRRCEGAHDGAALSQSVGAQGPGNLGNVPTETKGDGEKHRLHKTSRRTKFKPWIYRLFKAVIHGFCFVKVFVNEQILRSADDTSVFFR